MKMRKSMTAAVITAALSLPLAGAAFADAGDAGSDTWITTKVKTALLTEGSTPGMDITVETVDGVVSLSGTVASEAEKEAAIAEARSVDGVRDVMADGLETLN
ncbi:BON domain-containing protein [Stutzerimonas tarimensis]|uniref:BON domain-containing protein n=1 Tax=Stutzerimonas tarimensis TaxID=1507735 RepID=A0ABV7T1C4_9GAMM